MTGHDLLVVSNHAAQDTPDAVADPAIALRDAVRDRGGTWVSDAESRPEASGDTANWQSTAAIWPTYHDAVQPPVFRPGWQLSYREHNHRFAEAAARQAARAATVWIEGHDLQLVPAMLRTLRPDTRIGFFLPIPFPPVELFMRLPFRDELLLGLLGADMIGLQTRRDVDNLLRAAQHLLDLPAVGDRLNGPHGRHTTVTANPTSVDVDDIARRAADPAIIAQARHLRAQLGNPRLLILGIDHLDHAAGIEHRLRALEQFLTERPPGVGSTVVVQIALPPRHRPRPDEKLRHDVEHLVARINGDHSRVGRPAVHYLYRPVSANDLVALYLAADLLLATPLRDGMTLTAKQYLAARLDNTGALILSEFSGAAAELRAAHLVNPYDLDDLNATIHYAATEPQHRAAHRIRAMRHHLRDHDAQAWTENLLSTLDTTVNYDAGTRPLVRTVPTSSADSA